MWDWKEPNNGKAGSASALFLNWEVSVVVLALINLGLYLRFNLGGVIGGGLPSHPFGVRGQTSSISCEMDLKKLSFFGTAVH